MFDLSKPEITFIQVAILVVCGLAVAVQGAWIWMRHYDNLRPRKSISCIKEDQPTMTAYLAWWGLMGSITLALWHVIELSSGNSIPAFWPRLFEWGLWAFVHQYFNNRIEESDGD